MSADHDRTSDDGGPAEAPAKAAGAREPGAPIPKDEIDPEMVSLRPRIMVGLVTAFSVLSFCLYLAIRLWPDLSFSGEGAARDVTIEQIAGGTVGEETHVTVAAELERSAAIRLHQTEAASGLRAAPVLGSGDQVWMLLDGSGWAEPRAGATYTGRLRRLSDMPFEDHFRAYVARHPPPRFITSQEISRGRGGASKRASTELTAIGGDTITVSDSDMLELVVDDPDAVTVVGAFSERLPDAAAWTKALADAGLIAAETLPNSADEAQASFEVRRTGALANTGKALEKAGLWGARVEPITVHHTATWGTIEARGDALRFGAQTLPWSAVDVFAVRLPRPLRGDPWVLVVGDAPGVYWYVKPLYGVLIVVALLFAWALVRTARQELFSPKVPARA